MMDTKITAHRVLYFLFLGAFFAMPLGTSPFTILGICILIVWFATGQFIKSRKQIMRARWLLPVAAIVILTWVGLIWSTDPGGLGLKYAEKTHYWLYTVVLAGMGLSEKASEHMMRAFFLGLLLNAFVAFLQVARIVPTFGVWGQAFYTGFYSGYNTLAILLILGMLAVSFYFRYAKGRKERILYGCILIIYFIHFVLLWSRGAYLTFILLSPMIAHNMLFGKRILFIFLAYVLLIGAMFASPVVQDRVRFSIKAAQSFFKEGGAFTSGKRYSPQIDRVYMWRWAFDLFRAHPLLGVGTGGYYKAILQKGGEEGIAHPHNNVLYVAVSYGVLGILVFGWFFWVLFKAGWQNRHHPLGFFILSSVLVLLVGGMTNTHILDSGGAFLLSVTAGLVSALPNRGSWYLRGENPVFIRHDQGH